MILSNSQILIDEQYLSPVDDEGISDELLEQLGPITTVKSEN